MSVVVSAKVPKELRERARRYRISVSAVVRKTLEEEVAKREEEDLRRGLDLVSRRLKGKVTKEGVISAVRKGRESR